MKKRVLLTLLLLLCALALSGCGKELTEEEIFTKTIHDFGDLRVDNLDEQEDANFIVYAEGVKEITTGTEHNIVLSVDEENLCYTFRNPNAALLAMEPGDMFWAAATRENPEGVTVKLKSMEQQGDKLIVYSETVSLSDMYVYIDMDMEVPLSDAWLEEGVLENGVEVIREPLDTVYAPISSSNDSDSTGPALLGASTRKVEHLDWEVGGEGKIGYTFRQSIGYENTNGRGISGSMSATLEQVWAKVRWSSEHVRMYATVYADWRTNHQFTATGKMSLPPLDLPLPVIPVPLPGGLMVTLEPCFKMTVSGTVKGSLSTMETVRKGTSCEISWDGYSSQPIDEVLVPAETNFTLLDEFNGNISAGIEIKPVVSALRVFRLYGLLYAGAEISGSYDPIEDHLKEKEGEYRHECKACIDGKIEGVVTIGCGVEAVLLRGKDGELLKEEDIKAFSIAPITIAQPRFKLKDFYVSFLNDDSAAEFGWDECPHKRWKTMVEVEQKNGGKADGASVTATTPDGEKISEVADEDGVAVLYLPNGENALRGLRKGDKGRTTVEIKDKTAEKELVLDSAREIFVVGGTENIASGIATPGLFPEAEAVLRQRYPDIVVLDADAWYTPESGHLTCLYDNALLEEFGIVPGDILIEVKPWMYYTGLSENVECRKYGEFGEYPQNLYVTVSMALGAKNGRPLMIRAIGMGAGFAFNGFYYYNETPTTSDADYWCDIDRDVFPEYDEDFTFIGYPEGESRHIVIDECTELSAPIPAQGILENEPILQRYAEWYLPYIFPYIDMLWNNAWEEDLVPIYPGDAA